VAAGDRQQIGKTMSTDTVEQILVIPTELFRRLGYFQGFSSDVDRYLAELFSPRHISYRPRPAMERDPSFKQLIPYVIFRHRDHRGRETVFQYTRGAGQGEGRLHRKRSVGIGGHISAVDAGSDGNGNPYEEGMRRELEEEVAIETPYTARCVGLINDDQTEVGQVHLGVVHLFDVEQPAVCPRETEIIECGFRSVEEILADMTGFETWSQICMQALFSRRS
jgi:predicted NUDIX family phosphoesterase